MSNSKNMYNTAGFAYGYFSFCLTQCRVSFSLKQNHFLCLETSFHLAPSQAFSSLRKCWDSYFYVHIKVYQKIFVSIILFLMDDVIPWYRHILLMADVNAMWEILNLILIEVGVNLFVWDRLMLLPFYFILFYWQMLLPMISGRC